MARQSNCKCKRNYLENNNVNNIVAHTTIKYQSTNQTMIEQKDNIYTKMKDKLQKILFAKTTYIHNINKSLDLKFTLYLVTCIVVGLLSNPQIVQINLVYYY